VKDISIAVVIRHGLVLVQHRWRREGWVYEFPGGAVDPGESGEDAALRELREETGLTGCEVIHRLLSRNEFGGVLHFIVMKLASFDEPRMIDAARRQTFHWMQPQDIPVATFPKADASFIREHLPRLLIDPQAGVAVTGDLRHG